MTNVFAVLHVYGEGDGYACTELKRVFTSLELATAFATNNGGIYAAPFMNGKWRAQFERNCGKYEVRAIPLEDK